jgi:hypothetical protein
MKARNWSIQGLMGLALVAALAGPAAAQVPPPAATIKPAALVNGESISLDEVESFLKQRPVPPQLTDAQRHQLRLEVVGMLIDDHLMQQFLRVNAPPVKDADVNKWLADLEASLKKQGHTLQEFYRERGLSETEIRHHVSNMLQWASYVKGHLNDDELKRYYESNRDFFDQVTVRASHIVLRVPMAAGEADRQAARVRMQALRQEIAAGRLDFAEAARKNSQCPSSAQGGDLGYFPRKFAVEETFARAAFTLKVGEVSDVVQTDYGFHLIKVTDRKQGMTSTFDKLKEEVREVAMEEMRQGLLAQQRKNSKVEIMLDGPPALKTPGPASR